MRGPRLFDQRGPSEQRSDSSLRSGVARNFEWGGRGHNFHTFFKRICFGRTNLKLIETQKRL